MKKILAGKNRTLQISANDRHDLKKIMLDRDNLSNQSPVAVSAICNKVFCGDMADLVAVLPDSFVDLLILDPPYNLSKSFGSMKFSKTSIDDYYRYIEKWFVPLLRLLRPEATVYFCGDWNSSGAIERLLEKYLWVRNRITWQRDKGRGAKNNWKNCCEDIWFATVGKKYTFNCNEVRSLRRVLAPYHDSNGNSKDWHTTAGGGKFRFCSPGNLWDDITVPFWSMPENTCHPTQKPEKLIAKLILASSREGDMVFDPFGGSGTTGVVAQKLNRRFCIAEANEEYCLLALKRLQNALSFPDIQGYEYGVFLERNTKITEKEILELEENKHEVVSK